MNNPPSPEAHEVSVAGREKALVESRPEVGWQLDAPAILADDNATFSDTFGASINLPGLRDEERSGESVAKEAYLWRLARKLLKVHRHFGVDACHEMADVFESLSPPQQIQAVMALAKLKMIIHPPGHPFGGGDKRRATEDALSVVDSLIRELMEGDRCSEIVKLFLRTIQSMEPEFAEKLFKIGFDHGTSFFQISTVPKLYGVLEGELASDSIIRIEPGVSFPDIINDIEQCRDILATLRSPDNDDFDELDIALNSFADQKMAAKIRSEEDPYKRLNIVHEYLVDLEEYFYHLKLYNPDTLFNEFFKREGDYQRQADQRDLFQELLTKFSREVIEQCLGFELKELSPQIQLQLLEFLCDRGLKDKKREQFVQFFESIAAMTQDQKRTFLRSFLSLAHGDDLAYELLTIGSHLESQELFDLLGQIENIKEVASKIEAIIDDGEGFGNELVAAIGLRVTESLTVLAQISEKGEAVGYDYDGNPMVIEGYADALDRMSALTTLLTKFIDTLKNPHNPTFEMLGDNAWQCGFSNNTVVIQFRPRPESKENFDKEHFFDGEARVNILINLDGESISSNINDPSRIRAVSFRLDREGIVRDEKGEFMYTDPLLPQGVAALDVGSMMPPRDKPGYRDANLHIGQFFAVGNYNRAQKKFERADYVHIRRFSESYGTIEGFEKLVNHLWESLLRSLPANVAESLKEQKAASSLKT